MNFRKLFASVAILSATGSALAQQSNYPFVEFSGFQSSKTRAEVMEELKASKASGDYVVGSSEYVAPDLHFKSTKSRAEVLAELEQAKADGTYARQDFDTQYPGSPSYASASERLASSGE
ncbi:DUF4148 domain-containing protein [Noviherbaspirillum sp. Root189]|uniref:DUF4148 domain-containing protein n=1 Tax=Noviherbaspirillum sp. Root189 TaxID=1736487 RepID=UPI00070AB81B|nr:DUF4148 domain-containing protein [Noviherbaspirillum sp. Root189]KRB67911.1 hypothetical protein ASE07_09635 [Noviherbaspirillum sp. Root189]